MRKAIVLAVLSLPLMFLWTLFEGIDQKVDVFVFVDHLEKPKWIAHDVGWLLTNIFLTLGLHLIVRGNSLRYSHLTLLLLVFANFRLIEYFLFRGQIPMLPIVGGILIYSFGKLFYKRSANVKDSNYG